MITVYGGVDAWKNAVGFSAPAAAYLILIDPQGVVRWLQSGAFDETVYASLALRVKELPNQTAKP